jgi:integral membrane protein
MINWQSVKGFSKLNLISLFIVTGRIEGLSLVILLFIAMPIKYLLGEPLYVKYVGMAHGILFLDYVFLAFLVATREQWGKAKLMSCLFLSCVPFGTFYFEKTHHKTLAS